MSKCKVIKFMEDVLVHFKPIALMNTWFNNLEGIR